jgi:hypothetical protein
MDKVRKITNDTLIPVGLIITIVGALITMVWLFSSTTTKVEAMEDKDCPTRIEFNTMRDDISTIKSDIKTLIREK